MGKKGSKKKEADVQLVTMDAESKKPEEIVGSYVVDTDMNTYDNAEEDKPLFVPKDEKIERVKKQVRVDRITKDRIVLDYWLRHELQLGTSQIKKLWNKMDEIYR